MIKRTLESFSLWSGIFILTFATAAYFLPYAPVWMHNPLRVVLYALLAGATTVLAVGHMLLIRRSESGRSSIWLTTFTHSKVAQSVAFWGIAGIMLARTLSIDFRFIEGVGYAMIGIAVGANVMAASTFLLAWFNRRLESRIWPTPWSVWAHRRKNRS